MILHDLADAGPTLIDRAVLTVGATAACATAIFILAVVLIAGAVTGLWNGQPAEDPATEYEEAA